MQRSWAVTVVACVVHVGGCDFGAGSEPEIRAEVLPVQAPPLVTAPSHPRLAFAPLELDSAALEPRTTSMAWVGGQPVRIGFSRLMKVGQVIGGARFGQLLDVTGEPLPGPAGLCAAPDFNGVLPRAGGAWWLSQFECQPGGIALTRVEHAPDGGLTAVRTAPVSFASVNGTWVNCAGAVTPWGTHLATEEYEPDARGFEPGAHIDKYWGRIHQYYKGDPTKARPYHYGWMPELTVADDGSVAVAKHYAMGRFSHEIGVVMPDRRTVYLSDDAPTHGGLFMFVADESDDLSAGHLYAARWHQTSIELGGKATLAWIDLGHSTDQAIAAMLGEDPRFNQLFDVLPTDGDTCTAGSTRVVTASHSEAECLVLRDGKSEAASRLETRRYAATLGATTEFVKAEGMALDVDAGRVYLALSAIVASATGAGEPTQTDHIILPENRCGGVYALDLSPGAQDAAGQVIDSAFVATGVEAVVVGRLAGKMCSPDGIANPDNLAYLPGHRALMIAEDTRGHDRALLWHFDTLAKTLTPVHAAPPKAEVTGIAWVPDLGGHGYLTITHQTDGDRPSEVGTLGPFPSLAQE